jgi:hypothetical protein
MIGRIGYLQPPDWPVTVRFGVTRAADVAGRTLCV